MNVKEIITDWLKNHNYDGLFMDRGCACSLDDLIPGNCPTLEHCEPGYKYKCKCFGGGGHPDHIGINFEDQKVNDPQGRRE